MVPCVVCATACLEQHPGTPYWKCPNCDLWQQSPLPPKVLQHEHEPPGDAMDEREKQINRDLAGYLFRDVMKGPGRTLDIGAKYPIMASELGRLGCEPWAMEAHPDGAMYARQLGVHALPADFETFAAAGEYKLVTLVHVFEHFYDPLAAMMKLHAILRPDGRLFIRIPDHTVRGFEQHLSPDHFKIHPYFHSTRSLLQLLVQTEVTFVIESANRMEGAGQTDFVLQPIKRCPLIAAAVIVKNEERDLPRAMQSFAHVVHRTVVVDTGSTDDTKGVALEFGAEVGMYIGASEKDEAGDWKLWDFSKARNFAVEAAENKVGAFVPDWVLWYDADDELLTPDAVKRASYYFAADCFGMMIESGGNKWVHYRMWRADKKVRFKGRCHEYAVIDRLRTEVLGESVIRHHAEPTTGTEDSNPRNLRILLREWDEEQSARTAFYIANTYRDAGRNEEAVRWYEIRIGLGDSFKDEWLFAHLYGGRCANASGDFHKANELLAKGFAASKWAEFALALAQVAYNQKYYDGAVDWAKRIDIEAPIPDTPLWRERSAYRDGPARLISWCYEHQDKLAKAIAWAEVAAYLIDGPDQDWDLRRHRLVHTFRARKGGKAPKLTTARPVIAIHRPGAIGDVLMSLNLIPALREANPGHDIHYFCAAGIGQMLGGIMLAAGVDLVLDSASIGAWKAAQARRIDLIGYLQPGYPEKPLQRHVMAEFAREMGLPEPTALPSLTLPAPKRNRWHDKPYATIQMTAAWSPYKNWLPERWRAVCAALPDIQFVLIGAAGDPVIDGENVDRSMIGAPMESSIALIANANLHVGVDSFAQHVAHYYWTTENRARRVPAVIIYGSTQATGTGYDDYTNIVKGLACQPCFREDPKISRMPRDPCPHMVDWQTAPIKEWAPKLHRCMAEITADEVVAAIRAQWSS